MKSRPCPNLFPIKESGIHSGMELPANKENDTWKNCYGWALSLLPMESGEK